MTGRYDIRKVRVKTGKKVQLVEEIMHQTDEKRGYQSLHLQFRIYDAVAYKYVNFPGEGMTVNCDGPKQVVDIIRAVRAVLGRMAGIGRKK